MSKNDLIAHVAAAADVSNADAKRFVDLILSEIRNGIARAPDGKYALAGFGVFALTDRPARQGRNPRTGEAMVIAASKSLKFRPASALKDRLAAAP